MKFLKTLLANILGTFIAFGLLMFIGFLFLIALAAAGEQAPTIRSGSVMVLELEGSIPERVSGDPMSQLFLGEPTLDVHAMVASLRAAAEDSRIEGLWIRTGTLMAPWSSLEAVRRAVGDFQASGKPVFASSKTHLMEEDEYFIASAADSVFMAPEGLFMHNGFALSVAYYADLLDKLNVEADVVRAGEYKGAAEPFLRMSMSSENEEQLQALVGGIETTYVDAVASTRAMGPDDLRNMMDSSPTFGAGDAVDLGLVDVLGFNSDIRAAFNARLGRETGADLTTIAAGPYHRARRPGGVSSDEIAVVHIGGNIVAGGGSEDQPFSSGFVAGSEAVARALKSARESSRTRAVVIRVDSPGGFAPAADEMLYAIQQTAEEFPVVISMGSMAASGGYWLAMGGDDIVAEASTITGSIGVFSLFLDISGLLDEKLGIRFDDVVTGPHADMFSGMRSYTASERAVVQQSTDRTYRNFLQKVADSRDMTVDEVDVIARGRVWNGRDAVDIGLVDELGGLDRALEIAAERAGLESDAYSTRTYPRERTFLERLSGSMSTVQAAVFARLSGRSLAESIRSERALETLRTLVESQGSVQAVLPMSVEVR